MKRDVRTALWRAVRTGLQVGAGAALQAVLASLGAVEDPTVRAVVAVVTAVGAAFGMNLNRVDAEDGEDAEDGCCGLAWDGCCDA